MAGVMGIDLGTTTVSAVMLDAETKQMLGSRTLPGSAFLPGHHETSREQDPEVIWQVTLEAMQELIRIYGKPVAIGLTGQMHGMLYVDTDGNAVSPLYTWQDGSGDLAVFDGYSAADLLKNAGLSAATGFGLTTHDYLTRVGQVPEQAQKMTTICDYVGMRLCKNTSPVICPDMAASWGCFDLRTRAFQTEALQKRGVNPDILPRLQMTHGPIGTVSSEYAFAAGVPVMGSLGDNQASYLGATSTSHFHEGIRERSQDTAAEEQGAGRSDGGAQKGTSAEGTLLLNIGTGSQVSWETDLFIPASGSIELRPLEENTFLLAGSGLCGGRAYAMLEAFYRQVIEDSFAPETGKRDLYAVMEAQSRRYLEQHGLSETWKVKTTFQGTRSNPMETGSMTGIRAENFTPGALTLGLQQGMLEELYDMYLDMCEKTGKRAARLVGSGNAIRKNKLLRSLAEALFAMPMELSPYQEEAAAGAALHAALTVTSYMP